MAVMEEEGIFEKNRLNKYSPVLKPLKKMMQVDVVVNDKSEILICHDKPLPNGLEWIEYDIETATMTFVSRGGKVQGLGETIHKDLRPYMKKAKEAHIIHVKGKKIQDMGIVKFVAQKLQ